MPDGLAALAVPDEVRGVTREVRLVEVADLVTDMTQVKHPFEQGQKGQRGIEW